MIPIALSIAGSDPSGGAGIQADLKTFHHLGAYGAAVITLITVQNSTRLSRTQVLDAALVREQIYAVLEDFTPGAIKTGALGSEEIVRALAQIPFPAPLVIDPVMISSAGASLLDAPARQALRDFLLPQAALVMPNLAEAAELAGIEVSNPEQMRTAALRIADLGPRAVLIKGGHLAQGDALDILLSAGEFHEYRSPRLKTPHTHGTGCTYSAAVTAHLAQGLPLHKAIARAKSYVTEAIRTAPGIGRGSGPLNHHARSL